MTTSRILLMATLVSATFLAPIASTSAQLTYKVYNKTPPTWPNPTGGIGCYASGPAGWGYGYGPGPYEAPDCGDYYNIVTNTYRCDNDTITGVNSYTSSCCGCGPSGISGLPSFCDPFTQNIPADGMIVSSAYQCEPNASQTLTTQPEQCDGISGGASPPFDKGCGLDERSCSMTDRDGAPVRFSSGRVESNPIIGFSTTTPDLFFGYRIQYNSHSSRSAAQTVLLGGVQDTYPTVHHSQEATHYFGRGWLDNFSDQLLIDTFNLPSTQITWVSQNGTVTFTNNGGTWKSWSGKYELIPPGGIYGSVWVVRTTDTSGPRKVWTFEEFVFQPYSGSATRKLARLKRHAVLTSDLTNLSGRYGWTVTWTNEGIISSVDDSLGRGLVFEYRAVKKCFDNPPPTPPAPCLDERTLSRTVKTVSYRPSLTSTPVPVVNLQMDAANTTLARMDRLADNGLSATSYWRFRYLLEPPSTNCVHCGSLLTHVIAPMGTPASSSSPFAPLGADEFALEENSYGQASNGAAVATYSKYPGREYAYEWGTNTSTQFDLHQDGGACGGGGSCPTGYRCRSADQRCYVATIKTNDANSLPTASYPADGSAGGVSGSADAFQRSYFAGGPAGSPPPGTPKSSRDASGPGASNTWTTYGYDTLGRLRCLVRSDNDENAFADASSADTSPCAGPSTSQIVRVDYTTSSITKTTQSLLSGNVVEVETLDTTMLLPSSTSITGSSKNIEGALLTGATAVTRTTTITRDTLGRITETNGPLDDSIALDKTSTIYNTEFSGFRPYDFGQVFQTKQYVGTSSSFTELITTYSNYDRFGVPHCVIGPNLDYATYEPSSDRLTWTIKRWTPGTGDYCSGGTELSSATVVMNADGNVRSITDPDGVCTTFEYTDANGYVGAPTRIRRAPSTDACGGPIVVGSGEVEIRTYHSGELGTPTKPGEPDRLASITRQTNGLIEFTLSFALADYDRERRLIRASTQHSSAQFSFGFTDVLQTSVTAPNGPGNGTWRTDTTVDEFARPTSLLRFITASDKLTHTFSYSSPFSPRPTQMTRGFNGAATSTTTFVYDDFGQLVETTVPEVAATGSSVPAPTRYEYDVAGRLFKRRVGVGTALVRTDVFAYDSVGRVLAVDNDALNPVNCASAPAGTPIQDEEYRYDNCTTPDMPSGFACANSKGRLTIARAVLQCGTSGATVKRGRWYDYYSSGQVKRVAYATVTGATIGTPAIMDYEYSTAGRLTKYRSPLNASYGTQYSYSNGRVSEVKGTEASPALIANNLVYHAFGPLKSMATAVVQPAGGGLSRTLKLDQAFNYDGSLEIDAWRLLGNGLSDIALLHQMFGNTEAGLISDRWDYADRESARHYKYDSLLRMTCEARGQSPSTFATDADCATTSPLLAGLFEFHNGQSGTQAPDVRNTAFLRAPGGDYLSPSLEASTYANGSSQVQSITRSGGAANMTIAHDALGRRSYELDSFDATRSRRDYTYLPNGQLGSIAGRDSTNTTYSVSMRYDEAGRPLTIAEFANGVAKDSYELFWDDADRLVAVNISFASPRVCGTRTVGGGTFPVNCTNVRWHYHYLGTRLVAATREMIKTGLGNPNDPLKRFWAITDERGLVYRLVDSTAQTYWQARWDATGWRAWVGTPVPEMWVPFALPGQVLLDKNVIYGVLDTSDPEFPFLTTVEKWGTRAYASGTGGTWTRPAIALNRWRGYDSLLGAFLQPDPHDVARRWPEGYAYARSNFTAAYDPSGSRALKYVTAPAWAPDEWAGVCDVRDVVTMEQIAALAYEIISKCVRGYCGGSSGTGKRKWLASLYSGKIGCPKVDSDLQPFPGGLLEGTTWGDTTRDGSVTNIYPRTIDMFYNPTEGPECAAAVFAHERRHPLLLGLLDMSDYSDVPPINALVPEYTQFEEDIVNEAIYDPQHGCFNCPQRAGRSPWSGHRTGLYDK